MDRTFGTAANWRLVSSISPWNTEGPWYLARNGWTLPGMRWTWHFAAGEELDQSRSDLEGDWIAAYSLDRTNLKNFRGPGTKDI